MVPDAAPEEEAPPDRQVLLSVEDDDDAPKAAAAIELRETPLPVSTQHAETIAREYGFRPPEALLIEGPEKPPLMPDVASAHGPATFDMGREHGGSVSASLHLSSPTGAWAPIDVPLRMLPYQVLADARELFNATACRRADSVNTSIERHNRYITSMLSLFIAANGCGTSAKHVTSPSPPETLTVSRVKRLQTLRKDKYAITALAVRYLAERQQYCGKDYDIERAVEVADDVAFDETVAKRRESGKIRFRLPGRPYATWSGNPDERDSVGRKLRWERGSNHSFISTEVQIVQVSEDLIDPGTLGAGTAGVGAFGAFGAHAT